MTETIKAEAKLIRCGGRLPTGRKCETPLCETDGKHLFVPLESGRQLTITPKLVKGFGIICDECGYETLWRKKMKY